MNYFPHLTLKHSTIDNNDIGRCMVMLTNGVIVNEINNEI